MTDYFIGDIQGCFDGLQKAISTVGFEPGKDTLWLTGDLIARGKDSLATLEYIDAHKSSIQFVLGNHDLHFIALANQLKTAKKSDHLEPLLTSKRCHYFVDFLREQPLLLSLPDGSGYMTHAGLPPDWQPTDACYWANQIEQRLASEDYLSLIASMYTNTPSKFIEANSHLTRLIYGINGFTRMRYCETDGRLNFSEKDAPHLSNVNNALKKKLIPWFEFQPDRLNAVYWVFGHWAALMGETHRDNIIGLDTGYVWGNYLTVLNWQNKERIQIQV